MLFRINVSGSQVLMNWATLLARAQTTQGGKAEFVVGGTLGDVPTGVAVDCPGGRGYGCADCGIAFAGENLETAFARSDKNCRDALEGSRCGVGAGVLWNGMDEGSDSNFSCSVTVSMTACETSARLPCLTQGIFFVSCSLLLADSLRRVPALRWQMMHWGLEACWEAVATRGTSIGCADVGTIVVADDDGGAVFTLVVGSVLL